jgi:hypothetical protein
MLLGFSTSSGLCGVAALASGAALGAAPTLLLHIPRSFSDCDTTGRPGEVVLLRIVTKSYNTLAKMRQFSGG